MSARAYVGADRVDAIPVGDRGFAYGDGLFETMRAHRGGVPWWDAHWSRLQHGAARLGIGLPAEQHVRAEAEALLDGGGDVLKLIVSRGVGGRGYEPGAGLVPTWTLSRHPLPGAAAKPGLTLRWCDTALALQPLLAGIKHCNRLEQVLARAEWPALAAQENAADDGLMCSTDGDVVGATAANVFVLSAGRWRTPLLDRCGVAGVCRGWALQALAAAESRLSVADVQSAEAVFLCNAVRGILPVARLRAQAWPLHAGVAALQQRLAAEHPAFNAASPATFSAPPTEQS